MTGDAHDAIQIIMKADTDRAPKMVSTIDVDDGSVLRTVISSLILPLSYVIV